MSLLSANLQAFAAIARIGTVHGAASELRLTQTGVTQRIRALERDLGTTLFLRSRKGMMLTSDGEALMQYCKGAEDLEGEAMSRISGAASVRPIDVSIIGPTSIMSSRVAKQCQPLFTMWPQLQLHFVLSDISDRINKVRTGEATMAIVPPEQAPNEMTSKLLKPDRFVLVASPQWKGRRITDILATERVIDFNHDDQTTINYLKKYKLIDDLKRPRLFINNNDTLIHYFKHGLGFGTLTIEIAKPYLDSQDLILLNSGVAMEDPLALVWYPRHEVPAYFQAILKAIK
ncbi:MAG: LysR family transcriptional regulator [Proteobacteria bacterium]|nr:LysR family transcriptional regulator [Pseudomonadota bacterium]